MDTNSHEPYYARYLEVYFNFQNFELQERKHSYWCHQKINAIHENFNEKIKNNDWL